MSSGVEAEESRLSRFLARRGAVPLVIAGAVAIVTMACLTPDLIARWQLAHARAAIRARGEPATLVELAPEMPPDDDNAAVLLVEAFKLMDAGSASEPADWMDFLFEEDHPRRADAQAAVKLHAKAMALAREALKRPRCGFDLDYTKGAALELPHLAKLRHLARLFGAEAILNALNGKGAEAADGIRQVFLLARALDEEPLGISKLVAIGILGRGAASLRTAERVAGFTSTSRTLLVRDLCKLDFKTAATQNLVSDRLMLATVKARDVVYTRNWLKRRYVDFRADPSSGDRVRILRLMGKAIAASRRPPWEARSIVEARCREVWDILSGLLDLLDTFDNEPWRRCYTRFMRAMATRDAAVLGLSCELFRSERGRYPAKLDDLAPELLDEVPPDPFTGKPFHYQLRDGGRGYIVYSVGDNLKDDGGVKDISSDRDDILWEGKARGKDAAPAPAAREGEAP